MGIISDISKKRWARGLFKRHVASDARKMEASGAQGSAPEHTASLAGVADIIEKIEEEERLQGVWLEPDDAASVAKSYMGRRRILKPVFTIGRRGALVPAHLGTAPNCSFLRNRLIPSQGGIVR